MSDCIFCKIAQKEIPTKILYEDEYSVAFNDLNPQAPVHILLIPKQHYDSLPMVDDIILLGRLLHNANAIAEQQNLDEGYRIVINKGDNGGQTVYHIHIHILGGRRMLWPPG